MNGGVAGAQSAAGPALPRTVFSRESDEWATPLDLFEPLAREYLIDLDVAASAANAKCEEYFDRDLDGLQRDWGRRRCWMNPPHSALASWVAKADQEAQRGAVVIALLPARTDAGWFHEHVLDRYPVCWIRGRVRFVGATDNAPFPSMLVRFQVMQIGYAFPTSLAIPRVGRRPSGVAAGLVGQ